MWLWWTASEEVEKVCEKWKQDSSPKVEKGGRKTPSQTRKGLERLVLTFEQEPYLPKKCRKGRGRVGRNHQNSSARRMKGEEKEVKA
jgi:hypothetical protein